MRITRLVCSLPQITSHSRSRLITRALFIYVHCSHFNTTLQRLPYLNTPLPPPPFSDSHKCRVRKVSLFRSPPIAGSDADVPVSQHQGLGPAGVERLSNNIYDKKNRLPRRNVSVRELLDRFVYLSKDVSLPLLQHQTQTHILSQVVLEWHMATPNSPCNVVERHGRALAIPGSTVPRPSL
jgi:hypothetical protein